MASTSKFTVPKMINGNLVLAIGTYDGGACTGPKRQPFANFCTEIMCVAASFSNICSPCGTDERDKFSFDASFTCSPCDSTGHKYVG